jgi:class 3 adenylate cyclase/tetratricopeptide (TPR) repeat protein
VESVGVTSQASALVPYVPRLVIEWAREAPEERWRELEGTLVFVDISGFTAMSERLSSRGKLGAEEVTAVMNATFAPLLEVAYAFGGGLLKLGGDALLLFFAGDGHEARAAAAAFGLRARLDEIGRPQTSVGPVELRMHVGLHSDRFRFFLVGDSHRELLVAGPSATHTVEMESTAEAGEILLSRPAAQALPEHALGEPKGSGILLAAPPEAEPRLEPLPDVDSLALDRFVPEQVRAAVTATVVEPEHRVATVAFLHAGGLDELEPEAAADRLEQLVGTVQAAAAEHGVCFLESDIDAGGTKIVLTAGAPIASDTDEERMLRTLRSILEAGPPLPLRIGVSRGRVFAGEVGAAFRRTYTILGDTAALAARLTSRAEPGQILASADVLERSRTEFETSHQPFLMKGKERPVVAYAVGPAIGVREEAPDVRLPLVGRERELQALGEALDAARTRQFRLVELVGEPGMGKSRLVDELKALSLGFQQLTARCEAYERSNAFFAIRSLLRPLAGITPEQGPADAGAQLAPWIQAVMPDLAPWLPLLAIPFGAEVPPTPETDAIDPAFRRDKLHEVVEQFLNRVLLMPTLIVVEDTHWIDDSSAFLLRHLAASPLPRPWLVCLTSRPEGESFAADGRGERIVLSPLPAEAATALALAVAEEVPFSESQLELLTERAGGNPLFVRELIASAREGGDLEALPETVETLLTSRIDRLDPDDRLLLRYASVVGPSFDLSLLEEILADQPVEPGLERWERLSEFVERESFVEREGGGEPLRFRHDLFRAMAYEGLSFRRRREIHGKVGAALERRLGDGTQESAGLLSLHFFEAGRFDKAWTHAVVAGRRAQAVYANIVAAQLYERALAAAEHLPELAPADRLAIWEDLGEVAMLFADYERAADAYRSALELADSDPIARTRLMRKLGVTAERLGRREEGLDWFSRALADLDRHQLGAAGLENRVELEIAYAGSLYYESRYDECIRWLEQAVEHAEQGNLLSAIAHACYILSLASAQAGRPDPRYHERALEIYEQTGELVGHGILLNNLGLQAFEAYRWDEALEYYSRAAELSEKAGDVASVARVRVNEADVLAERGQLAAAEERLRETMRVWRASNYALAIAITSSNLGRIVARAGRTEEARALLEEARTAFAELGNPAWVAEATARIAEAYALAGEYREARAEAEAALAQAHAADAPPVLEAMTERLLGYALVQARQPDEAVEHFERSLALAREVGANLEVALTLRAMSDAGLAGPEAASESADILRRLSVVSLPRVPLP